MRVVGVREARRKWSRLLESVRAGEQIVITKRRIPYARLCPVAHPESRQPGLLSGTVDEGILAPLKDDELDDWEQ